MRLAHKLAQWLAGFLAVCALSLGCSSGQSQPKFRDLEPDFEPVTFDSSFTAEEKAELTDALEAWNQAAGKFVHFEVVGEVDHDKWMDRVIEQEDKMDGMVVGKVTALDEDVCGSPDALACASVRGQFSAFNVDKLGSRSLRNIALHEFGHHLGLGHLNIRDSLMYPAYLGANCIDMETLKALATARPSFRLEDMKSDCHES